MGDTVSDTVSEIVELFVSDVVAAPQRAALVTLRSSDADTVCLNILFPYPSSTELISAHRTADQSLPQVQQFQAAQTVAVDPSKFEEILLRGMSDDWDECIGAVGRCQGASHSLPLNTALLFVLVRKTPLRMPLHEFLAWAHKDAERKRRTP